MVFYFVNYNFSARGNFYLRTNPTSPFGKYDELVNPSINHGGPENNEIDVQARYQTTPNKNVFDDTRQKAGAKKNEARLWNHPGVNTLASFVRVAELNLVK